MRLVLGLTALLCSLTDSLQQPCKSPPYLTGNLIVGEGKIWNYEYNAALQRMRVYETEHHTNQTFTYDYLLHFREGVMYEIDGQTFTCTKKPLRTEYQPIGIPHDADYLDNFVLGSLSVPKAGISMQAWTGYTSGGEEYSMCVTEEGCVPYYTIYNTEKYGEVVLVFMNSTMHTTPQDDLNPPRFCPNTKSAARPVDLVSLFSKSKARLLTRTLTKLKNVYLNDYTVLNVHV
uniref:Ependymin n=1 Tax=Neogobius melanostomus TaxID=47308 RepID=A0A8C6SXM7_9GOBI